MATWFIRLGSASQPENRTLNEDFAENHSLVKIGYGIDKDITGLNDFNEVKNYLEGKGEVGQSLRMRAGLLNTFINHIEIGDKIISPFGRKPKRLLIGEVISHCGTVESFFKGKEKELDNVIANHPKSDEKGDIKVKPAIKVKWQTQEIDLDDSPELVAELSKTMRSTIHRLNIESTATIQDSLVIEKNGEVVVDTANEKNIDHSINIENTGSGNVYFVMNGGNLNIESPKEPIFTITEIAPWISIVLGVIGIIIAILAV